jgi:transposase
VITLKERYDRAMRGLKAPLFVRPLTAAEQEQLEADLRSSDAFTLRRAQILLASARKKNAREIADALGCCTQSVRNPIRAFDKEGVEALKRQSNRPKSAKPTLNDDKCEQLKHLLHQSPRTFEKPTSLWTLELAADICFEKGLTEYRMSRETIRRALKQMKTNWKRAKHWISSPDPAYVRKKRHEIV